jgi:peptidyl-prolyl cis-trans isomerase B (cyclophilin B)
MEMVSFNYSWFHSIIGSSNSTDHSLSRQKVLQLSKPRVKLETSKGPIVIGLYPEHAPNTVENFLVLVKKAFYDGLTFHRAIPGFIIQTGCPIGDGTGNPGYTIPCECIDQIIHHDKVGVVSMAHGGRDTGGSQFFITLAPQPQLDNEYTIFGQVIDGLEIISKIVVGDTIKQAYVFMDEAPRTPEREKMDSEQERIVQPSVAEELEPMEEISQMMNRIRSALETVGISRNANDTQETANAISVEEKIPTPTASSEVENLARTSNISSFATDNSVSSRLEEAISRSRTASQEEIAQNVQQEAEMTSLESEPSWDSNDDPFTIGGVKGAMLGGIQELGEMFREEKPPSLETMDAYQSKLETPLEDKSAKSLSQAALVAETQIADEIPLEETIEEPTDIQQALQETTRSLNALLRTTTRIVIALQLVGIMLAGILAFEIVAVLATGYPNNDILRDPDLLYANIGIMLGALLLWLVISAVVLTVSKTLLYRQQPATIEKTDGVTSRLSNLKKPQP